LELAVVVKMSVGRDEPVLEPIRGIRVLDVDTHLTEVADLWTSRAPARFRDLVPRVVMVDNDGRPDGLGRVLTTGQKPVWVVGEGTELGYAGGASVINKENVKIRGSEWIQWPLTEVSAAASYVRPRLEMLDEVGIWGQIVYPNAVGFGGQNFARISDEELRLLCLTIWNDAMAEMQQESGQRLFGMAMLPWWDVELAVAEIARIHQMGIKGVNLTSDPQNYRGLPDLSDPYFQPMWDACVERDLPVNFHIGAAVSNASYMGPSSWPSLDNDQKLALGSALLYMSNARVLANFIYSGILERNPQLKVVSVESGIGWMPFILKALDYQAVECKVDNLSMKPSDYFRRQVYGCFWFEDGGRLMDDIELVGVDNCMFETDFPHPTCLYPQPLNGIAQTFADHGTGWETRKKLLGGTAARVYHIDLPED
jgi:predicted TIM-barrel fold metal-dependent hydrolase